MNTLATKLTVTVAIVALIAATPVSIDLVRPASGSESTAHLALTIDFGRVDHPVTKLPGFAERAHQRRGSVHAPLHGIDTQPDGVGR